MAEMKFVEVKAVTEKGHSQFPFMINLRCVSSIRPAADEEKGTCTFLLYGDTDEVVILETWEVYEDIRKRITLI